MNHLLKHKWLWIIVAVFRLLVLNVDLWTDVLVNFDIVVHTCITVFKLLDYCPFRHNTFEYDFQTNHLLLTMLITDIPICRDATVWSSFLKSVGWRLDLPMMQISQI